MILRQFYLFIFSILFLFLIFSLGLVGLLISEPVVVAAPFHIIDRHYGTLTLGNMSVDVETIYPEIRQTVDNLFDQIESSVNRNLPKDIYINYLKNMGESQVLSHKGLGVDYSNRPDFFVMGAGVSVAADIGDHSLINTFSGRVPYRKLDGVGVNTSVMVGVRGSLLQIDPKSVFFDPDKLMLFLNGMSLGVRSGKTSNTLSNFGAHFQYPIYTPPSSPNPSSSWWRWGGIHFTSGFDYSSIKIKFTQSLSEKIVKNVTFAGVPIDSINAKYVGTIVSGAETDLMTIPMELSTYGQLFSFYTLFGGLGIDINNGTTKSLSSINGTLTIGDQTQILKNIGGKTVLLIKDKDSPKQITPRIFLGQELALTVGRIFTQFNHILGTNVWGVSGGIKIVY